MSDFSFKIEIISDFNIWNTGYSLNIKPFDEHSLYARSAQYVCLGQHRKITRLEMNKEIQQLKDKIIELEFLLKRSYKSKEKSYTPVVVDVHKEELTKKLKSIELKLKFTKIVELENELYLYFEEYSKLLQAQKIKFPLVEIIKKLENYELKIKELQDKSLTISKRLLISKTKILNLSQEDEFLKSRTREILLVNKSLKEKVKDLEKLQLTSRKISVKEAVSVISVKEPIKEQLFSRPVSVLA